MEIGLFTFAELTADPVTGRPGDPAERLRDFVALAELADQAGLDVFGVGEHHRPDFAIASPPVVLAAIAQATDNIRLTSTVTVLSSADPVKVFEDFVAVDLISGGRAEITAGRGAYTESFPLFGYDLADYDELFEEKLDLLLRLNNHERVTWSGRHRARCKMSASILVHSSHNYRCGSRSAEPLQASCVPGASACRSTWPFSANPITSLIWPTSIAAPESRRDTTATIYGAE
jgi:alkanesulfonate monooxygenase SsuD/methylene tetrahydromethanopterin reductase-like flavin-dependent oxidoreductase (luciferase family)